MSRKTKKFREYLDEDWNKTDRKRYDRKKQQIRESRKQKGKVKYANV